MKIQISIVTEEDGENLNPLESVHPKIKRPRKKSAAAHQAFLAAAGSWKEVDTDKFLEDNRESRNLLTRSHVEL